MEEYNLTINNYPYRIKECGEGVPFFWLHGMFHSFAVEDCFAVIDFSLFSQKLRLIRVEIPLHGGSPTIECSQRLTWHWLASDILGIADHLNLQRFAVGGFSQGAAISAHIAALAPERVSAVALAMLPRIWENRPGVCKTYLKVHNCLGRNNGLATLERIFAMTGYPPPAFESSKEVAETIRRLMLRLPLDHYLHILEGASASDFPSPEKVAAIQCPAFLVAWENDVNHPVDSLLEVKKIWTHNNHCIVNENEGLFTANMRILAFILNNL